MKNADSADNTMSFLLTVAQVSGRANKYHTDRWPEDTFWLPHSLIRASRSGQVIDPALMHVGDTATIAVPSWLAVTKEIV